MTYMRVWFPFLQFRSVQSSRCLLKIYSGRQISYVQGQSPESSIREYFYFIDHQGMLFLDDSKMKNFTSCFKDKKFLVFFFKRLKRNTSNRYPEFPYLSLCGRERNYVRCDDFPIVFTHVNSVTTDGVTEERFCYGHVGDVLSVKFEPDKVFMLPENGRIYHPAPKEVGSIGLIRSQLAIEISKYFRFEHGEGTSPTHLIWNNQEYTLNNDWFNEAKNN